MMSRSGISLLGLAAMLAACSDAPVTPNQAPVNQPTPGTRFEMAPSSVIQSYNTLTGLDNGVAYALNDAGHTAGWSNDATTYQATYWVSRTAPTSLGNIGGTNSYAFAINATDMVVGQAQNSNGEYRAFSWTSGGGMVNLGVLGSGNRSAAYDVNGNSDVVGTSNTTANGQLHAFLYNGSMTDIGADIARDLGATMSAAYGINDNGVIVGLYVDAQNRERAFRRTSGTAEDLGTLGGPSARARGINGNGDVVGWSTTSNGETHATMIPANSSTPTDVGTLGGMSFGYDLDDAGHVVGWTLPASGVNQSMYWTSGTGLRDLGTLDVQQLSRAQSINNNGDAVGRSNNRPVLWHLSANAIPTASIAGPTTILTAPNTDVIFDGSSSVDMDGDIRSYSWTFSDNLGAATTATTTRQFSTPGTYDVTLRVTDWRGSVGTATVQVVVE